MKKSKPSSKKNLEQWPSGSPYKVGDVVRLIKPDWLDKFINLYAGQIFIVDQIGVDGNLFVINSSNQNPHILGKEQIEFARDLIEELGDE